MISSSMGDFIPRSLLDVRLHTRMLEFCNPAASMLESSVKSTQVTLLTENKTLRRACRMVRRVAGKTGVGDKKQRWAQESWWPDRWCMHRRRFTLHIKQNYAIIHSLQALDAISNPSSYNLPWMQYQTHLHTTCPGCNIKPIFIQPALDAFSNPSSYNLSIFKHFLKVSQLYQHTHLMIWITSTRQYWI